MKGILFAKWKQFFRTPWMFLLMIAMSFAFAFIVGGSDETEKISVPAYAADTEVQHNHIGKSLEASDSIALNWMSEKEMKKQLHDGKANFGVKLQEDSFQLLIGGVESLHIDLVNNIIEQAYQKQKQQEQIVAAVSLETEQEKTAVEDQLQTALDAPVFTLNIDSFSEGTLKESGDFFRGLFGFTLFFVIYTISYNVLPILTERADGIWDRVILSPVKKWEMYVSNLIYSFLTGYLQVVIVFLVFRYGFGVDFSGRFAEVLLLLIPYLFTIVALAVMLTALVKNQPQFSALLPLLAVSMAMLGGAFWPLEIVDSNILLFLSKINPLTYGMEIMNGVAVYGYSMEDLLPPISILLLMGVILMGVGMHLMEKRHL